MAEIRGPKPLKKKHDKRNELYYEEEILLCAQNGVSLSVMLLELDIRLSDWTPFVKRSKKVQLAIQDAEFFFKAYGQKELAKMVRAGRRDPSLVKLAMASFYDITEEHKPEQSAATKPGGGYTVVTQMISPAPAPTNGGEGE